MYAQSARERRDKAQQVILTLKIDIFNDSFIL